MSRVRDVILPQISISSNLIAGCPNQQLSGFTTDGTFQQYVVSWVSHVTPIPEGLDSFEAASILCAGVTVYRALKYSKTHIGDWVAIPGAGGGLGHLAVQYATAMGLRVLAVGEHHLPPPRSLIDPPQTPVPRSASS